jgi:hypothetical protein
MIVGQEVMEITNSLRPVQGQPRKVVLAETSVGVFLIFSVSDRIFLNACFYRRPLGEPPRTTVS